LTIPGKLTIREKQVMIAQTSKRYAKAFKVFMVISTQMNRKAEDKKGNTKGTVSDVAESDAYLQEADLMLEVSGNRNAMNFRTLDILKAREAGAGNVTINFQLEPYPDFSEASSQQIQSSQPKTAFKVV